MVNPAPQRRQRYTKIFRMPEGKRFVMTLIGNSPYDVHQIIAPLDKLTPDELLYVQNNRQWLPALLAARILEKDRSRTLQEVLALISEKNDHTLVIKPLDRLPAEYKLDAIEVQEILDSLSQSPEDSGK